MEEFFDFIKQPGNGISKEDFQYLSKGADKYQDGIPTFYCLQSAQVRGACHITSSSSNSRKPSVHPIKMGHQSNETS